jgi:hypothetical protein
MRASPATAAPALPRHYRPVAAPREPSFQQQSTEGKVIMGFKYGVSTWRIDSQGYKWGWKV